MFYQFLNKLPRDAAKSDAERHLSLIQQCLTVSLRLIITTHTVKIYVKPGGLSDRRSSIMQISGVVPRQRPAD